MYDTRSSEIDRTIYLLDVLCTIVTFLFSFWARNLFYLEEGVDIYSHLFLIPLLLTLIIFFLSSFGGYKGPHRATLFNYAWSVFRALAVTIGTLMTLLFFLEIQYISRLAILIFAVIELFVLFGIRYAIRTYYFHSTKSGVNSLRVLIIGTGERARGLASKLREQAEWGLDVIGHLDPDPAQVGNIIGEAKVLGTVDDISACLKKYVVDEVIIAIPRNLLNNAEPIAQACEEEGIKLRFMADLFQLNVTRMSLTQVGDYPLLTLEPVAHDENKLLAKRVLDLILTTLAMPIVLPIMAIVAIAIKLDSSGPALFIQQRVGLRKHLFPMMKFRSMHTDAEERMKEIEHLNEAEGPIFKMTNDPRMTRVGRFIRKTSLDELPQLFNVLRGEMSLVGPRPMSIRDVDLFDKGIQRKRFSVTPGITCIWQISGRSNLPFSKWLELDLQYIENWSLRLDLMILLKTLPAVLKSKGAA